MVGSTPTRFRHLDNPLPKAKRKKQPDPGTVARRRARAHLGQPPAERVLPDKRKKQPKHKKQLLEDAQM